SGVWSQPEVVGVLFQGDHEFFPCDLLAWVAYILEFMDPEPICALSQFFEFHSYSPLPANYGRTVSGWRCLRSAVCEPHHVVMLCAHDFQGDCWAGAALARTTGILRCPALSAARCPPSAPLPHSAVLEDCQLGSSRMRARTSVRRAVTGCREQFERAAAGRARGPRRRWRSGGMEQQRRWLGGGLRISGGRGPRTPGIAVAAITKRASAASSARASMG